MSTEENILQAARKVFREKGLEGTRMQEIADEAGINKALLHYYFRSKDKLFMKIFSEAIQSMLPSVRISLQEVETLSQFLIFFISQYFKLLHELPWLPRFILQEVNRNPLLIKDILGDRDLPIREIEQLIKRDVKKGLIIPISVEHLMVNVISMIIFPFAGRPVIQTLIFKDDIASFQKFLEERSELVSSFVINAISIPNKPAI
jgi:TetR/AcrR family transcriptional regulator